MKVVTCKFHAGKTQTVETQRHRVHREGNFKLTESPIHDDLNQDDEWRQDEAA
jgi:hypothetical protein